MMIKTIAFTAVLLAPGAYAQFGSAANAFQSAFEEATMGEATSVADGTFAMKSVREWC